jgi:hypothetical protein
MGTPSADLLNGLMPGFYCVDHLRLTYRAKEGVVIAFRVQQNTNVVFYVMLHEFFELFKSITGPTFVDFRLLLRFGVVHVASWVPYNENGRGI